MPITSNPDAIYLSPEDFCDRFGFEKPGEVKGEGLQEDEDVEIGGDGEAADISPGVTAMAGHGGADPSADLGEGNYGGGGAEEGAGVEEVVFYCKAGVRSRTAARMAAGEGGWQGVKVGEMGGGWLEWEGKGGEVER